VVAYYKPDVSPNRNGWSFWVVDDDTKRILQRFVAPHEQRRRTPLPPTWWPVRIALSVRSGTTRRGSCRWSVSSAAWNLLATWSVGADADDPLIHTSPLPLDAAWTLRVRHRRTHATRCCAYSCLG
jgi:hypothetical protein